MGFFFLIYQSKHMCWMLKRTFSLSTHSIYFWSRNEKILLLSVLRWWFCTVDSLLYSLCVGVLCLVHVLLCSTCVLSSFAIISLRKRELVALLCPLAVVWLSVLCLFLMVPLVGWSAVCDCGISWSYSLTFSCGILMVKRNITLIPPSVILLPLSSISIFTFSNSSVTCKELKTFMSVMYMWT